MRHIFFYLFLVSVFFSFTSFAEFNAVIPKPRHLHLGYMATYYKSSENFSSSGGGFNSLANGGDFQEVHNTLMVDYDLTSRFRLTSALNFAMVQAKTSAYSNSNSYLDYARLGGEFWFFPWDIPSLINFDLVVPVYEPNFAGAETSASEGVYAARGDLILAPNWGRFRGNVQGGLLYLMEGRGGRIPWNVGASFGFSTGRIEGGVRGEQSVIKDSSSAADRLKRTNLIVNGQAGSLRYFAVDPSYQEFYVSSRWGLLRQLDLSTDLAYSFNGEKYSKGITAMIGFHWMMPVFGGSSGGSSGRSGGSGLGSGSSGSEEDFQYEGDKYQESLFNEADPSRTRRRTAPRENRPRQKSIKQMLDEAERSLEE